MSTLTSKSTKEASGRTRRFTMWPLWASVTGILGFVSTVILDERAGQSATDIDYTVTVSDMPGLSHLPFRIGGFLGYLTVAALLVLAAQWRRRVTLRFGWSTAMGIVPLALTASAGALALAYGWKGALGDYLHGAIEHGAYDDAGLYVYYMMNDFSPYIGWLPVLIALGAIAWSAFGDSLISRPLGIVLGALVVLVTIATAATGVPGLPFLSMLLLALTGVWLAFGRHAMTEAVAS